MMYYNQRGERHPRGTLELNAGSRLKKIPTKEHAFHVVSDKQVWPEHTFFSIFSFFFCPLVSPCLFFFSHSGEIVQNKKWSSVLLAGKLCVLRVVRCLVAGISARKKENRDGYRFCRYKVVCISFII